MLFGTAGGLLGPALLLGADAAGFGWRGAFLAAAAMLAVYGACIACLPLPPPDRSDDTPGVGAGLRTVARDRRVWFLGLLALLMGTLQQPFTAFVVAYRDGHPRRFACGRDPRRGELDRRCGRGRNGREPPPRAAGADRAGCAPVPRRSAQVRRVPRSYRRRWRWRSASPRPASARRCSRSRSNAGSSGCIPASSAARSRSSRSSSSRASRLPVAVGRVADAYGVHAGLACFVGFAFGLLLLAMAGDHRERRAAQASKRPAIWPTWISSVPA